MARRRKAGPVKVTTADGQVQLVKASSFKRKGAGGRRPARFYERYLRTPHFRRLRAKVLQRDGWRCQGCGQGKADGAVLQAHHLTYERVPGRELLEDLTTLCRRCHFATHRQ